MLTNIIGVIETRTVRWMWNLVCVIEKEENMLGAGEQN